MLLKDLWDQRTRVLSLQVLLEAKDKYQLHFWDAMIFVTAQEGRASIVYTEDFQHGRRIESVQFVNPLQELN